LVRVTRRVGWHHYANILAEAQEFLNLNGLYSMMGYNTCRGKLHSHHLSPATQIDVGLDMEECLDDKQPVISQPMSDDNRFPFNDFTCCLTLFSKYFSSFDHSTCALSVSRRYLALEEIYLPIRAAFPNNSTLRRGLIYAEIRPSDGILTLYDALFQGTYNLFRREIPSSNYNASTQGVLAFKFELLPLHSPLLRQSRLVSFPPLIDMLKFSGYPHLI